MCACLLYCYVVLAARSAEGSGKHWKFNTASRVVIYCKTQFFCCILISRFSYLENLLHFNLEDFYYRNCYCIIVHILQRILHITSQNCWYSMQINLWWWAILKICVYLILQFCSNRKNLMLAKYTCFTVVAWMIIAVCCNSSSLLVVNTEQIRKCCAFWTVASEVLKYWF